MMRSTIILYILATICCLNIGNAVDDDDTAAGSIVVESMTPDTVPVLKRFLDEAKININEPVVQLINEVTSLVEAARQEGRNADHCLEAATCDGNDARDEAEERLKECYQVGSSRSTNNNRPTNGFNNFGFGWTPPSIVDIITLSLDCKKYSVGELISKLEPIKATAINCINTA